MSNESENRSAFEQYRRELQAMIGDISKIDEKVLTESVNEGLADAKRNTPVGKYPSEVSFTTKAGKRVTFAVTPKIGGTLRRGWHSPQAVKTGDGVEKTLENNVEYASYVNDGHRVVNRHGESVGYVNGKHMLEHAGQVVENAMTREFSAEIEKVNREHDR